MIKNVQIGLGKKCDFTKLVTFDVDCVITVCEVRWGRAETVATVMTTILLHDSSMKAMEMKGDGKVDK